MAPEEEANQLPIVQYWHSAEIPSEIKDLTATFGELNPDLHHRVYCEAEARTFIGDHYTSREVAAFDACAVPAMQADYFRYCAILAFGGVYSDVDLRCLRSLQSLIGRTSGGLLLRREPPGNLVNGFFVFSSPGHPLLQLALDAATANIESRAVKRVDVATGPWIFTGLAALHRAGSIEAIHDLLADTPAERAEPILDVIGDFARLEKAFENLEIKPLDAISMWIGEPATTPAYKLGESHWVNWHKRKGSIFR